MTTQNHTQAQRIAVRAAREALAEVPDYRDNTEPLYWVGRLKAATELLLDAFAPDVAWARPADSDTQRGPYTAATGVRVAEMPVPEHELYVCALCGIRGAPMVRDDDGAQCYNAQRCAERVAARDAEAAQVTR